MRIIHKFFTLIKIIRRKYNTLKANPKLLKIYLIRNYNKLIISFLYRLSIYRLWRKQFYGLHLGSGNSRISGFSNIDANLFNDCDIVSGIERINLGKETVDFIYNSHVFEHIVKHKAASTLKEWHRVLKKNGNLYICVPDVEKLMEIYLANMPNYRTEEGKISTDMACGVLYGGQINKYDFHYNGYSFTTLKYMLEEAGFKNICKFKHSDTIFRDLSDAGSTAKISGQEISLNVVASK